MPDSTLYGALQHVARAIAQNLSSRQDGPRQDQCPEGRKAHAVQRTERLSSPPSGSFTPDL